MVDNPSQPSACVGRARTACNAAWSEIDAARSREAKVLALVRASGPVGRSADEVANDFGWYLYSSRPRLSQLKARGAIMDSGQRRPGESGRRQIVWVLAPSSSPCP
jgi:predicted ArsR family transcriptional regulator